MYNYGKICKNMLNKIVSMPSNSYDSYKLLTKTQQYTKEKKNAVAYKSVI